MLRSNRATWLGLTSLTVFVAFGTLLYATGVLDYGTYLPWRLKGHGSNIKDSSFSDLNSTIPPKIAPHCVRPVEEWDSSRFLKGRPTKLFRGAACSIRGVLFNSDYMQKIFLKNNLTLLVGRLLGSVRSCCRMFFGMGTNLYPASEPVHGLRASLFVPFQLSYARMIYRVTG